MIAIRDSQMRKNSTVHMPAEIQPKDCHWEISTDRERGNHSFGKSLLLC